MKYIKKFESYKKGYWVFKPKPIFSYPTSRLPVNKYTKEEAIKYFSSENKNIYDNFEPVYFEEEEKKSNIFFKEEKSDNEFLQWLRDEKDFEGNEDDLKFEFSAIELDILYNEFTGY